MIYEETPPLKYNLTPTIILNMVYYDYENDQLLVVETSPREHFDIAYWYIKDKIPLELIGQL